MHPLPGEIGRPDIADRGWGRRTRTLAEITDPAEVSAVLRELEFKGNFDLNPFRERLKALVSAGDQAEVSDDDMESMQRRMKGTLDRLKNAGDSEKE